jgi:hypothetical protein
MSKKKFTLILLPPDADDAAVAVLILLTRLFPSIPPDFVMFSAFLLYSLSLSLSYTHIHTPPPPLFPLSIFFMQRLHKEEEVVAMI